LETKARTLRLPIHVTQQLRALHRAHERLWQQGLSTDLVAVAAEAGVDLKAASLALRMAPGTLSLDTPAAGSESDLLQLLPSAEPSPLEEAERHDRWERVGMQLRHLPERDQQVLRWRYLTPERQKLSVVGEQLGCSRERARQIEQRALMRLRLRMAS
jgi:RNA polymerase sigma factor (sigma-70 family)